MSTNTQNRPPLTQAIQQLANLPAAALISSQIEAFSAAGSLSADKDLASCDASGGTFTITLPGGADVYVGKPYSVKEFEGTNPVTVATAGSGLIDGSATLAIAAGEAATVVARSVNASTLDVAWDIVSQTAPNPAAGGELLAANNLSDVSDADASRANLDAGRLGISIPRVDLVSATAAVYRYVHQGPTATVVTLSSAITGTLTVGDATITGSIDGAPITTGVITITQVGSLAGDVDSATPSAANILAAGAVLELTVGGTQTAAEFADVSVEMTY